MRARRLLLGAVLGGLASYAVAWPIAFGLLVGNWQLAPRYFSGCWTGGGERVAFLQLSSQDRDAEVEQVMDSMNEGKASRPFGSRKTIDRCSSIHVT